MIMQAVQLQKTAFNHLVMRPLSGVKEKRMSELGFKRINQRAESRMNLES